MGRQTRNLIRGVKLKSQAHAAKKGIENTIGRVSSLTFKRTAISVGEALH